jgi:energy-coupling factor transporter ATP-binding protein EcfA2
MKIKSLEIVGFMDRERPVELNFYDDVNIITGRNGSGKTNVLKLLWYFISGNILQALKEVPFKKATIVTSEYEYVLVKLSSYTCRIEWTRDGHTEEYEDVEDEDGDIVENAEDRVNSMVGDIGASVFLPTFRRIEGGFTLGEQRMPGSVASASARTRGEIEESLAVLSRRLTKHHHVFVASLSTLDIVNLLVRQHANLSDQYNKLQEVTSQDIIQKIKAFKSDPKSQAPTTILDEIRVQIEGMERERGVIMRPLDAVTTQVMTLFRQSGIKLGKSLSFGDAASAVNSDALSAGEKQMLSFISYNAFTKDAVIVIDEPELSLHVDWQRQLFPILLGQQATNQFIVATHSPFIYSKYPDREIQLDIDRGDEQG